MNNNFRNSFSKIGWKIKENEDMVLLEKGSSLILLDFNFKHFTMNLYGDEILKMNEISTMMATLLNDEINEKMSKDK